MADFTINIRNVKRIQEILRELPTNLRKEAMVVVKEEFEVAAQESIGIAMEADFSGTLSSGISADYEGNNFVFKSTAPYSAYHEFGTRSNVRRIDQGFQPWAIRFKTAGEARMIPYKNIKDWLEAKVQPKSKRYNVWRKISMEGRMSIKSGRSFFIAPYIKAKARVLNRLGDILSRSIR
jgi:phage gpG-like protein